MQKSSKKFYNKCSENSRSQIAFPTDIFQILTLDAPEISPTRVTFIVTMIIITFLLFQTIHYRRRICQAARSLNCAKEDEPMLTEY